MPELTASVDVGGGQYHYGYYVVLAVMAAICAALFRAFKRSGWL
jgi:magnesium transporter